MHFFWEGFQQAWQLIWTRDPDLMFLVRITVELAVYATGIALLIGLPIGVGLGLGRFRGRTAGIAAANFGLGFPPVVVGLTLSLLMFPAAPLGRFHLLFTFKGMVIAQTILEIPIVIALSAAAVAHVSPGLLAQARAFGAGRAEVGVLAVREARIGILAAVITAVGSAVSEVGAIILVGGNIYNLDQTLASAAMQKVLAGRYADSMAIAILLMAFVIILMGSLTWIQFRSGEDRLKTG